MFTLRKLALAAVGTLVPLLLAGASIPANAQAIPATQQITDVNPSATSATFREWNPNGIVLTPALLSVMPANVATRVAQGQKVVSIAITHEFFAVQDGSTVPTPLSNWEQLNGLTPSQYNVITSQYIGPDDGVSSGGQTAGTMVSVSPTTTITGGGGGGSCTAPGCAQGNTGPSNELSMMVWVTQDSTTTVDDTFSGQAVWAGYDYRSGHTDYGSLTWWPSETIKNGGTKTMSAEGVYINNLNDTAAFPITEQEGTNSRFTVYSPQTQDISGYQYELKWMQWSIEIYNSQTPNGTNDGGLDVWYTQTWTSITPTFSVSATGPALSVTGTSDQQTWMVGPANWSPNVNQTD